MSKPAAIQGDFASYRPVLGRKVLQLVIEVPIEAQAAVFAALGFPTGDGGIPVGIARLQAAPEAKPEKPEQPKKRWGEIPPVQQAGIACGNESFRKFLNVDDADAAAVKVRAICEVTSRSELKPGTNAAHKWADLYGRFENWQRYGE